MLKLVIFGIIAFIAVSVAVKFMTFIAMKVFFIALVGFAGYYVYNRVKK